MSAREQLRQLNHLQTLRQVRSLLKRIVAEGETYFPSPIDWRDEVLYFLLPDRFSDAKPRPLLTRAEIRELRALPSRPDMNWQKWAESGSRWQGGTLKGLESRLPYLRRLGITTIWLGPIFKQRVRLDTYHGYGIQDFLDVDRRFGSRQDLVELVQAAHGQGLRIILDVIINHSGDNWGYQPPNTSPSTEVVEPPFLAFPSFYGGGFASDWKLTWRDEAGAGHTNDGLAVQHPHAGVWPEELRDPARYTRAGKGELGAGAVDDAHAENKRTDFLVLKDFALDVGETLSLLLECFKYWIALSDCDGFRIDTVKHISLDDARAFCGGIREFAEGLGKRDFLLVGEVAGGDDVQDFFIDRLGITRRNLSAALDIGGARLNLVGSAKGLLGAETYLEGFKEGSEGFGSHRTLGDRHVSILDDHDHVFGAKLRFSSEIPDVMTTKDYQVVVGTALQLFTLGIPCIYYGTEQAFSGPAHSQLSFLFGQGWGSHDKFLREAMFGPEHPRAHHSQPLETQVRELDTTLPGFGAFGVVGKHCFDTESPSYVRIAALCRARANHLVLRTGRQYAREVRLFGGFVVPPPGELVAWSRILDTLEALCVVNPNGVESRGGQVVVSSELNRPGDEFVVVVNTAEEGGLAQTGPRRGTLLSVRRDTLDQPAYLDVGVLPPAEVLILVRTRGA